MKVPFCFLHCITFIAMQAALIIINGYPGVGKSTIAKELA
jgi:2-phosphoglycerate kinase